MILLAKRQGSGVRRACPAPEWMTIIAISIRASHLIRSSGDHPRRYVRFRADRGVNEVRDHLL
jgi:hypothetical protein